MTEPVRSGAPSTGEMFDMLVEAIDALPYPFALFDSDSALLACSNVYREQNAPALDSFDGAMIGGAMNLKDVLEARYGAHFPPEEAARHVSTELSRHAQTERRDEDVKTYDQWMRRSQRITASGGVVEIAFSVDEWVERSRALLEAKRELEHQAFHDPLTELPNRRALTEHIGRVLKDPKSGLFNIAFLHIDLDKFKAVNDTLGHDAGDVVIREAASVLNTSTRSSDLVARIGGDEFVVICHGISDETQATGIAERIVERMREPIAYGEEACQIGASIGIAICRDARELQTAMTDADIALYEAKRNGRGCFKMFSPQYRDKHTARQRQITEITTAVNLEAFEPWFQPQVCGRTGELVGAEALARWINRERGVLSPAAFSDALSDLDLSMRIDDIILRKALAAMARFSAAGIDLPRLSVNLSSHQLSRPDTVDRIKWSAETAGIAPGRIGLEILESVLVDDSDAAVVRNVRALSEAGFHLALDDFGTGRSSIAGLQTLSLDCVKIDRRFCKGVSESADLRTIASAIVSLAKNLNLEVLCEGVEAEADLKVMLDLGCDVVQGYHIGRPMAEDVFGRWLVSDLRPTAAPQANAA